MNIDDLANLFLKTINSMETKQKPLKTEATVLRVDGDTVYVHVDGGVPETPVTKTIDCKKGDRINIETIGSDGYITGNKSAPPTDDTTAMGADVKAGTAIKRAKKAQETADEGLKTARKTKQYFWHVEEGNEAGAHITEIPQKEFEENPSGGNTLITSAGMTIRKGLQKFGEFLTTGLTVYNGSGTKIAQLGFGAGNNPSGGISEAPYYDIGIRTDSYKGNYSVVEGYGNIAGGYGAVAEGVNTRAEAFASHAAGYQTMANRSYQFVCGSYNSTPLTDDMLFIVGNGTSSSNKSNAFEVHDDGRIKCGNLRGATESISISSTDFSVTTGSISSVAMKRFGNVVQLTMQVTRSAATDAGSNMFAGTLNLTAYRPKMQIECASYSGSVCVVGSLDENGTILARVTGAQLPASRSPVLTFTYLI